MIVSASTHPRRGLFFFRRLLNKPVKRQGNTQLHYDDAAYVRAMKQFQKETRGMLPESDAAKAVRNRIYAQLRIDKTKAEQAERAAHRGQTISSETAITADFDSFYNLMIVVPESPDCYEAINVLNYYGFPHEVEEDNPLGHSRKDMGFEKTAEYPLLMIDSNTEDMPAADLVGKHEILRYLYSNQLIGDYMSRSAWESQGLDWVDEHVQPAIEDIFRDWRAIVQFYSQLKHFRMANINRLQPAQQVYKYLAKMYKAVVVHTAERKNNSRAPLVEKHARFQSVMDEYCDRMGDKHFHGGERPDAVDFRTFSLLQRVYPTFTVKTLFE